MITKTVWKLVISAFIVIWSISSFLPFNDIEFDKYLLKEVSANKEDFEAKLAEGNRLIEEDNDIHSIYVALRRIGETEKVDFSQYFPHINIRDIRNLDRRNEVLLKYLYSQSKGRLKRGLDLEGGVSFTLKVKDSGKDLAPYEKKEQLDKVIEVMTKRIDSLGVSEPVIRAVGDDRIEIQMPGLDSRQNPDVIDSVKKPANLEFRMVHRTIRPSGNPDETPPPGYELLEEEEEDSKTGEIYGIPYYVKRIPEATGEIVERARPTTNPTGGYEIQLKFTGDGTKKFANITSRIARENQEYFSQTGISKPGQLAIVLDGKLYSAPTVRDEILGGNASISGGNMTQRDAIVLASVLNNPLAVKMTVEQMSEVGPSLAADARTSSIQAALYGAGLVVLFMVLYYWLGGLAAVISVFTNVIILLGILSSIGATMTLPGVAALVLTVGMAVDANILIFERIREELRSGKSVANALSGGYEKALSTIIDANVTTLITAMILIWLGTGPVKGFGVTLSVGIGASMFCALVISRVVLDILVHGLKVKKILGLQMFSDMNFNFLKFRVPAFITSWTIVLIGVTHLVMSHEHIFGIDFVGGDELSITYPQTSETTEKPVSMAEFAKVAADGNFGEVSAVYQDLIAEAKSIIKVQTEVEKGKDYFDALVQAYPDRGLELIGETRIGGSVSSEIQRNAILSIVVALGAILLYVAIRFEVGYGVGAVVATVHDVFMTLGVFVFFGGQFTAPMIAAVLMILGYSINDTIVVFDRIREELGLNPEASLWDVIRLSINRVFSRTILTSLTTFIAAVVLYLFGAGIINDFAFVFMVGIITGTFSSIFIASPIFYWWHKGDRRHVEERELLPKYDWQASSKGAE